MENHEDYKDLTPSYKIQLVILYRIFGILISNKCPEDRTLRYCLTFYGEDCNQIYNPGDMVEFNSLVGRLKWVLYCEIEIKREADATCNESNEKYLT